MLPADAGEDGPTHPPRAGVVRTTAVLILVVYLLVPHLAGIEDTWNRIRDGSPAWLAAAVALEAVSYAGYAWNVAAVSAADRVVLGFRRSAQITLAATAATRLLAAGGAGGIAVTTWALSRAGHGPRGAAKQVSSHLVATYAVFVGAIVLFGTGLAIAGAEPLLSAVPAVLGALLFAAYAIAIQAPDALQRRLGQGGGRWRQALLAAPQALADGTHFTIDLVRRRELGLLGTVIWWVFDVATLWACFWAFGGHPNVAELTMAYLLGHARQPAAAAGRGWRRRGRHGRRLRRVWHGRRDRAGGGAGVSGDLGVAAGAAGGAGAGDAAARGGWG